MDTRRRLAELDPDDEDPSPFEAAPSLSANKLARFTGALPHTSRKSKFERDKEIEAERAKKQEEEAAKAYNEFVEAFGGDEETGPETHRRSGVSTGRGKGPSKGFVRAGGEEKYNPLANLGAPPPPQPLSTSRPPPPPSPSGPPASFAPTGPRGFAAPSGPRGFAATSGPRSMAPPAPPFSEPRASTSSRPKAMSFMDDDEVRSKERFSHFIATDLIIPFIVQPAAAPKPVGPLGKKKREGDNFLEQLKRFLSLPSFTSLGGPLFFFFVGSFID